MAAEVEKTTSPKFAEQINEKLSAEHRKAISRLRWVDRLTSLWAPVTIFGLVFCVYLVIVESSVCTYEWLLGPLRAFGALCVVYYAALWLLRLHKPFIAQRDQRHRAEELVAEVEEIVRKKGASLNAKARSELLEGSIAVWSSYASGELRASTDKLQAVVDKHLALMRLGGPLSFVVGFGKALLIALVIRSVLIEPYKIPSGSMIPTLAIGDQIFVNKFIYGVRIPFTNYVPFVIYREPKRGDVIVFNNPVQPDKDFIKRVIGVPGDKIEFGDHAVIVNGQQLSAQLVEPMFSHMETQDGSPWETKVAALKTETIDGRPHRMLHQGFDSTATKPWLREPIVVPPKSVFVMGDNRDNSEDSRLGLGSGLPRVEFVPFGNIKGKAMVIWLSLSYDGLMSRFFKGTGLRTDRLFLPVTLCGNEGLPPAP